MRQRSKLVLALDETDPKKAVVIARKIARMDAIKVGYPLVLSSGLDIVSELKGIAPVICDFKIADIPDVNRQIAALAFEAGASAIISHAFPGSDSLKACVEEAHGRGGEAFAVVEMSHPGATDFLQPMTTKMVEKALEAHVDGLIAPGTRPERIREVRRQAGDDVWILSPGIGTQGGSAKAAIEAGADFVIVGRSLCKATDPAKEAKALVEGMGGQL